jgi:hypothetical protein
VETPGQLKQPIEIPRISVVAASLNLDGHVAGACNGTYSNVIGNYLGLTVVHINRVLRSLRSERIVDLEKNCVTTLDLERLVIMARNGGTASCRAIGREHQLSEAAD